MIKNVTKNLTALLYLMLLLALTSCSGSPGGSSDLPPSGGGGGGFGGGGTGGTGVSVSSNPTSISTYGLAVITATVNDASGNPVADGTSVTFALSSSTMGTLSSTTATTTGGTANVYFTAGNKTGSVSVTATSGGLSGSVTINITASATAGVTLTASPSSVPVSGTSTVTADVVDSTGNPVPDMTPVTFSLSDTTLGKLSTSSGFTTNGKATVTFTASATASGTVSVNAAADGKTGQISITIIGGITGGSMTLAANPTSITTSGSSTITATIKDSSGNPIPNATVNFSISSIAATLSAYTAITDGSGVAQVVLTAGSTPTSVTVTATSSTLSGLVTITVSQATGVGSMTLAASPSTIPTNGTSTISATVLESNGTPVQNTTVTFSLSNTAGTLDSLTALTNTSGVAQVTLTSGVTPTSVTVSATASTAGGTVNGTATVTIVAPTPAIVSVAANPVSVTVLGTSVITATVKDSNGNPVIDGTPVSFALSSPTFGTLSSTTTTTANSNGTATTTFTASNVAGTVTITATAGPVSSTASVTVTPAPTGSILFVSATPQIIGLTGTGAPASSAVKFQVKDINGNPVADGTAVSFVMKGPGGGEYIGALDSTPNEAIQSTVGGYATVILNSGTRPGPVTVTASTNINSGASTMISAAIDGTITTINVASTAGFPSSGRIRIDNELIDYTGTTATSFTGCVRGSTLSIAQSHASGATVYGQSSISSSATQIAIGGGAPSATHVSFGVEKINLPGLHYIGETSNDSVFIADRFGNYNILTGTSISFGTEGGAIDTQGTSDSTGKTTVVFRTQNPMPDDVGRALAGDSISSAYFGGGNEPYYTASPDTLHSSGIYNPRDGWVTVLATTQGEEKFLDENVNGIFTRSYSTGICPYGAKCECDGGVTNGYAGFVNGGAACATGMRSEGFVDLGEPFYDVNDDGVRDDGSTDGKPYEDPLDANGNGTYDLPNGMWDGPDCQSTTCEKNKVIWLSAKHVFSGDPIFFPRPDSTNCYNTVIDGTPCGAAYVLTGAKLTAGIDAVVTSIPVTSTTGYPTIGVIKIDNELITYTSVTATSFDGCTRGAYGTTAAAHSNLANVDGQTFTNGFAEAPASLKVGSGGSFKAIVGDVNLNRLQPGTTIKVTATNGTVAPTSFAAIPDGLSTGPTVISFTVSASGAAGTYIVLTVEVTTPKGIVGTLITSVPIVP